MTLGSMATATARASQITAPPALLLLPSSLSSLTYIFSQIFFKKSAAGVVFVVVVVVFPFPPRRPSPSSVLPRSLSNLSHGKGRIMFSSQDTTVTLPVSPQASKTAFAALASDLTLNSAHREALPWPLPHPPITTRSTCGLEAGKEGWEDTRLPRFVKGPRVTIVSFAPASLADEAAFSIACTASISSSNSSSTSGVRGGKSASPSPSLPWK
mmetsp:Transcript_10576/g.21432  ORF Transcript_10576/g.21432 Transcript_10576/m.21432 type:complete len:212 (+) Transcript_10576:238-873(+)